MEFRDLKRQYECLKEEIDAAIQGVLDSAEFILGKPVQEFEKQLADYVGVRHCVTCGNGTDALQLVLMAWGIGPGDAVFTSDFTYFASAGTSSILGATPILVDIDSRTFNINPTSLEEQILRVIAEGKLKPRVIIPVDLFGQPADYTEITRIAKKYDLLILEDGAQGFGGNIRGKHVGSFGDAATTSFFPAKPLGCYGDGGAIFTDNDELDAKLRSLRAQGRSPEDKYDNGAIGMNSRLDTIQAAILMPKFKAFVNYELDAVNRAADCYTEHLKDVVTTPLVKNGYLSSWAQYTIRLNGKEQRNAVQRGLKQKGIPSMIYYPRGLHQQTAYLHYRYPDEWYPNTIAATQTVLSLPMHPYLDEATIEYVAQAIKEFV